MGKRNNIRGGMLERLINRKNKNIEGDINNV
jgi:hypothetical protein